MSSTQQRHPARNVPRPLDDFDSDQYDEESPAFDPDDWELPRVHNRRAVEAPVGLYVLELVAMVREKESRYDEYIRIRFEFRVVSVIDAQDRAAATALIGEIIQGWANLTMGPKSTMRAWSEALLDRALDEDEQPRKTDLIGRLCKGTVVPHQREDGNKTTKLKTLLPYVGDETPIGAPEPRRPPQAQAAPPRRPAPPLPPQRPTPAPRPSLPHDRHRPQATAAPARPAVRPSAPHGEDDPDFEPINQANDEAFDPNADPWDAPEQDT
jgi:hypothetical protein